jgi:carbonic anhydrase
VKHIIICGHYDCGGVKAAMHADDLGLLNPWLRNIRDVYRHHIKELNQIENPENRFKRLVELNVQEQYINIAKTACVQKAYHNNKITLHGWVFDISIGKLIDLKINLQNTMKEIEQIYKLS